MKKNFQAIVMATLLTASAWANTGATGIDPDQDVKNESVEKSVEDQTAVIDFEAAAIDPKDIEESNMVELSYVSRNGERIVGSVFGGIMGVISAIAWDNRHNDCERERGNNDRCRNRYGRPNRPGQPGRSGELVTCYAQNRRGENFRAASYGARRAQQRAMDKCQSNSRFCREQGCRS